MPEQGAALKAPHWRWPVVLDFFVSGTAAGAYVVATLALLAGGPRYPALVKAGYLLAFPLISLSLVLLIVDLGLPRRFLHMLWSRKGPGGIGRAALTLGGFHFKPLSPISTGAWALSAFAACAFAALVLAWIAPAGWAGRDVQLLVGLVGGAVGFFVGGYKGVLLRATALPVWSASRWLGPLFLAAALSSGLAAVALTAPLVGAGGQEVHRLARALALALVLEGLLLAVWLWDLGAAWRGAVGPAMWAGRTCAGFVLPLAFLAAGWLAAAALIALAGGLTFRYLVVAAAAQD